MKNKYLLWIAALMSLLLMATAFMTWSPAPLNTIDATAEITVTTAGTPVPLNGGVSFIAHSLVIQADPTNTAASYIYLKGPSGNIGLVASPGQSITPPFTVGGIDLSTLSVDASANGEKAYVMWGR